MKNLKTLAIFALIVLVTYSCKKDEPLPEPVKPDSPATPYIFNIPTQFPTIMNIPADNPMTVEGVELGRYLFYDERLAGREDEGFYMSCATCHLQENSFENGVGFAYGLPDSTTGNVTKTPHVMLPLINLVWNNEGYLWNGAIFNANTKLGGAYGAPQTPEYNFKNIESLVWLGLLAPHEMNSTVAKSEAAIRNIEIYPPMFKAAFGTPEINIDRISKAIAQFLRTLVASNSKVHKSMRGEAILSDSERRGLILFTTEAGGDCFHCHGAPGAPLFTTNLFYNNAKDSLFTGAFSDPRDRYAVTKNPTDLGAYKATTLINIEKTGPYMHDGRFATLMDVINFYSEGLVQSNYANSLMHKLNPPYGNGAELIPSEKQDLLAFLKALTDNDYLANPDFSKPADLPDFP